MNKLKMGLTTLLMAQVILTLIVFYSHSDFAETSVGQNLLNIQQPVTRLAIDDAKDKIELIKVNDNWQIANNKQLSANAFKIHSLLDNLKSLKTNWPTATTEASHQRFEVSEEKFNRHIQLYSGDQLISDVYLGTSPGFKQSQVRLAGDDNVYALKINISDVPVDSNDWLDKSLLQLKSIEKLQANDYNIVKIGSLWQFENQSGQSTTEETVDQKKSQALIDKLANLRIVKETDESIDAPDLTFNIESDKKSYLMKLQKKDNHYLVSRDDIQGVFSMIQSDFDSLSKFEHQSLLAENSESHEAAKTVETGDNVSAGSAAY